VSARNGHTLLVGRSGSGKTRAVRELLKLTACAIVLDPEFDYDPDPGDDWHVCYELDAAVSYFLRHRWGSFVLVFRPDDPATYGQLLAVAVHAQKTEPHGPLVIVLEEASKYGDTWSVETFVRAAYNKGRHLRLSVLTVIQVDTDFHRVARHNSRWIVSFAQHKVSGDFERYFDRATLEGLHSLDVGDEFERVGGVPEQGRNFVVHPPGVDLYREWYEAHGYWFEPAQQPGGAAGARDAQPAGAGA
jgi:hypothetical protein